MELATRVFDRLSRGDLLTDVIRERVPEFADDYTREHWRRTLRMAALCHDLGHLPFSHAAEERLLPDEWDHERLTVELIRSDELGPIWADSPPLNPDEVAKLAVGPEKFGDKSPKNVEAILSEIITGKAFGVDRMDYLLRDSLHAGVAYGRFDHYRLIDTMRILEPLPYEGGESEEPTLGVEQGGIHSAEALLLARYFMFAQIYFHRVRRACDIHLQDFLEAWLPDGRFPVEIDQFLGYTDNEVMSGMLQAAAEGDTQIATLAKRVTAREHFRVVYEPSTEDSSRVLDPRAKVYEALCEEFDPQLIREDHVGRDDDPENEPSGRSDFDFPVLVGEDIVSSTACSDVLNTIPEATVDYVFVAPELREKAKRWVAANRDDILEVRGSDDNNAAL
jgi:HD superfamily phosphohydrolase